MLTAIRWRPAPAIRAEMSSGQAARVRAAHPRGARHPIRPAVVHRRARLPQVGRGRARPSSRPPSPRASASTARRSRASPGSTRRTCSPSRTRRRSRSCRGAASPRARRACSATSCMPDGSPSFADPRFVLKRALGRAAELGFTFYTHPEIEFFLLQGPRRTRAGARRRSTAAATSTTPPHGVGHDFRREAITMLEAMGISVEFSHHEGAPGPAGDRPALRRRADHGRQHHDLPPRGQGGRARAGHLRVVHAEAVHRSTPGRACTRTSRCSRATATRSSSRGRVPAVEGRPVVHRRPAPARAARSPPSPTSGSTPTSGCPAAVRRRRTSAGATTTARRWCACRCTSRTRASRPGSSSARSTPPATRTSPTRCCWPPA